MARPVDIHIHLTDEEYRPLSGYLKIFLKSIDMVLVSVSTGLKTAVENIRLAEEFPGIVIPFIGVHPQTSDGEDLGRFLDYFESVKGRVVGIGEIGLDRKPRSTQSIGEKQHTAFRVQLELAEKLGMPVSIHSRGALEEVFEVLTSYSLKGVLLHWFSGGLADAKRATDRGYYASFGPALVYSKRMRMVAKGMCEEYILTETDGPVHYGGCFDGRMALPTFLSSVLFALASALGRPYEDILKMVYENSIKYVGLKL